jgi:hypothetical protein
MLDRIFAKSPRAIVGGRRYGPWYDRAGRHASVDRIADLVRADIALVRAYCAVAPCGALVTQDPIAYAPEGVTFFVEPVGKYGIVVVIDGVPQDWGWVSEHGVHTASLALRELAGELADLMNAYNHDGGDIQRRFFPAVRAGIKTLVW